MEEALRRIVQHVDGTLTIRDKNKIFSYLKECENKRLIKDIDEISRLHDVRKLCNSNTHEVSSEMKIDHDAVHFAVMQIKDLLNIMENILVTV